MDEHGLQLPPVWFSATLRFACYSESPGFFRSSESVYTFQAVDHAAALTRVLQIGRADERIYINADGMRVRIALVEVESLNMFSDNLDGTEVYWWPGPELGSSPYAWDHVFTPDASTPGTAL